MKHILHTKALMGLMILMAGAAAVVASCKKDPLADVNPPVADLAAAPFTLSAVESRNAFETFEWTVDKYGNTDSVSEELDEMTVTIFNTFTFTVKPDSGSGTFPGVNLRSSNTNIVKVNALSKETFTLSYVGDGEATITVWNGSQTGQTSITFKVVSRRIVHPTAFRFVVDGENVDVKCWDSIKEAESNKQCVFTASINEFANKFDDISFIHKIVFKGFVPENCSYDMVAIDSSTGMQEDWCNWLIGQGYNKDEFFVNIYPLDQGDGYDRYSDGGPISSLKGKIGYFACVPGAFVIAGKDDNWDGRSIFRVYIKNTIYTKYFVCYEDGTALSPVLYPDE